MIAEATIRDKTIIGYRTAQEIGKRIKRQTIINDTKRTLSNFLSDFVMAANNAVGHGEGVGGVCG